MRHFMGFAGHGRTVYCPGREHLLHPKQRASVDFVARPVPPCPTAVARPNEVSERSRSPDRPCRVPSERPAGALF